MDTHQPIEGKPRRWYNAGVPVLIVIGVALYGFYTTGRPSLAPGETGITMIIGNADPFAALLLASFAGCAAAIALACFLSILTPCQAMESCLGLLHSMLIAIVFFVMSWVLGGIGLDVVL